MSAPANGSTGEVRVVLVDDQPLLREGIATILEAQPGISVVGQASSGAESLDVVASTSPDVVCMDVEMPGMNGLEATRRIISAHPDGPQVLVLTTFDREDYLLEALRAGASAFLLKTTRPEQLADAIRSVADGDALLSPEVTRSIIERAVAAGDPVSPSPTIPAQASLTDEQSPAGTTHQREDSPARTRAVGPPAGQPVPPAAQDLTSRERDVLTLVARGMSNDEIAAELVIGRATVKTHVSNVLMKLHLRDRVQAVAYAYRHGLTDQH